MRIIKKSYVTWSEIPYIIRPIIPENMKKVARRISPADVGVIRLDAPGCNLGTQLLIA